jgi:hypothetical protein
VFRAEVLREVVGRSFERTGASLSLTDFGRILRDALTSWVPVVLELNEDLDVAGHDDITPELEHAATMIRDGLDEADRLVLRTKLSGASDTELASLLGVSRPTAAKRKTEAFASLRETWEEHASDVDQHAHHELAQLLYLRLLGEVADE